MFRFQDNTSPATDPMPRVYTLSESQKTIEAVIERIGYTGNDVTVGRFKLITINVISSYRQIRKFTGRVCQELLK